MPPEVGKRVRHAGDEDTRLGHIRNSRKAMTFITSTWALCVQICGTAFKGLRPFCRPRHRLRLVTVGCFMALGSRWKELWGRTEGPNTREICRSTSGRLEYNRENLRRQLQPWARSRARPSLARPTPKGVADLETGAVGDGGGALYGAAHLCALPCGSAGFAVRTHPTSCCTVLYCTVECSVPYGLELPCSPVAQCELYSTVLYCTVLSTVELTVCWPGGGRATGRCREFAALHFKQNSAAQSLATVQ